MKTHTKTLLAGLILLVILSACSPSNNGQVPVPLPDATEATAAEQTLIPTQTATPPVPPEQLIHGGDKALFVGDYETALETFQSTLAQTTNPDLLAKSQMGLGQAHIALGNFGVGLSHLRTAAEAENPIIAARAQYLLGQTFTQLERYGEALEAYAAYLDFRPGLIDSHVHELRGDLFRTMGQTDLAIASFVAAHQSDPGGGSEGLAVKIAVTHQEGGDLQTALTMYTDIYNTSDNDYTKAEMGLRIGRIHLTLEQPEQAYAAFQDAVNNFPYAYDSYTALVTLVNDGIAVNEYQRGLVNFYVGNYALAVEAFDRYLAEAPDAFADGALYHKGLATRATGGQDNPSPYQSAVDVWQTLITDYPASPYYEDAWRSIEYTLWAFLGEPQQAAQTSLDFVAQRPEAPDSADFLFLAGRSFERAGLLAEAAETWARIANEYPNSDESFRADYFSGIALVRLGDWAGAQRQFSRALVLTSQPAEVAAAHLWIGKSHEALGDISAALDSWKQAQIANPFGHYSIRAEDLLIGREPFTEPESFDLDPDLSPYRMEAEAWVRQSFNLAPDVNLESPGLLANDLRFQRGHEFWALGHYDDAKTEFESLRQSVSDDPAQTFRLIPALVEIGLYRSAVIASTELLKAAGLEGGNALSGPEYFSRIRFGAYYLEWLLPEAESTDLSPLLILATIRQESLYESFARSGAGARGLMQVMPETGAQLAADLGWPQAYTADDLYRPYVSLRFGTTYLRQWHNYFDGDLFAMLAAYNGGPGNTIFWKDLMTSDDSDLFLEIVRVEETRNYIRLINEIHYIYRWLYGSPMEP